MPHRHRALPRLYHLMAAARYVALNPVRARLVERAWDWPHSSVRAHLAGRDDGLVRVQPLLDRAPRFADFLETDADDPAFVALRRSELIGRPLGDSAFQNAIGRRLGRVVTPGKRGRRPKGEGGVSRQKEKGKDGRAP
jgi:putative transposase